MLDDCCASWKGGRTERILERRSICRHTGHIKRILLTGILTENFGLVYGDRGCKEFWMVMITVVEEKKRKPKKKTPIAD